MRLSEKIPLNKALFRLNQQMLLPKHQTRVNLIVYFFAKFI